jgi:hypothetical protein
MEQTINRLAIQLGLPKNVILKAYKAYWLFIKTTIEGLPLKEPLDEEALYKLRPNFNIPNLGKLSCTYERYKGIHKRKEIAKKKYEHKEDKANG